MVRASASNKVAAAAQKAETELPQAKPGSKPYPAEWWTFAPAKWWVFAPALTGRRVVFPQPSVGARKLPESEGSRNAGKRQQQGVPAAYLPRVSPTTKARCLWSVLNSRAEERSNAGNGKAGSFPTGAVSFRTYCRRATGGASCPKRRILFFPGNLHREISVALA